MFVRAPQGLRAGLPVRPRGADPERARPPRPHRPYRAGYPPRAAPHDRARAARTAVCSASSPPTRSSSASTSARSTASISVGFPGSIVVAAPAVGPRRAPGQRDSGCWSPARTSSTSTWPAIHRSCSTGRPRPRSRIRRTRRCCAGHLRCARRGATADAGDARHFGDAGLELARSLPDISPGPAGLVYRGSRPSGGAHRAALGLAERGRRDRGRHAGRCLAWSTRPARDSTVHEGAIYLHLGQQYVVRALDTISHVALAAQFDGDYYTQTRRLSATSIEEELEHRELAGTRVSFGTDRGDRTRSSVTSVRRLSNHEPDRHRSALDMPRSVHFHDRGCLVRPRPKSPPRGRDDLLGSLHARPNTP